MYVVYFLYIHYMEKLTLTQLQDRADNKLEALIFFATKKLQELKLQQDGVIN